VEGRAERVVLVVASVGAVVFAVGTVLLYRHLDGPAGDEAGASASVAYIVVIIVCVVGLFMSVTAFGLALASILRNRP
jgi:hypothetical protein